MSAVVSAEAEGQGGRPRAEGRGRKAVRQRAARVHLDAVGLRLDAALLGQRAEKLDAVEVHLWERRGATEV